MRPLVALAISLGLCTFVHAQDARKYPATTAPVANGQFEIVQSPILARDTFKLDRFTGRIWQLVEGSDEELLWEQMLVQDAPSIRAPEGPRFQLFLSGIVARDTFLIDTRTGRVWILTAIKSEKGETLYTAWVPIKDRATTPR